MLDIATDSFTFLPHSLLTTPSSVWASTATAESRNNLVLFSLPAFIGLSSLHPPLFTLTHISASVNVFDLLLQIELHFSVALCSCIRCCHRKISSTSPCKLPEECTT